MPLMQKHNWAAKWLSHFKVYLGGLSVALGVAYLAPLTRPWQNVVVVFVLVLVVIMIVANELLRQ